MKGPLLHILAFIYLHLGDHRIYHKEVHRGMSRVSNIESDTSQNVGLEDYNNISDKIFPYFTTSSIKITLGYKELENSFKF